MSSLQNLRRLRDRVKHSAKPVPGSGGYLAGDGPGASIPANLDAIPDAVPVSEPLHRYANQPYVALEKTYTPITVPGKFKQRGIASWYGKKFHGQRTSSGEKYNMYAMTAAHPILPIPSYARVTNVDTGKSVVVRINDRGPFMHDRVIDLSYTAARPSQRSTPCREESSEVVREESDMGNGGKRSQYRTCRAGATRER